MNISFTTDDIIAASTIGGTVLSPIVLYIKYVHSQQNAMWRSIDMLKEERSEYWRRTEQEAFRRELKDDFEKLSDKLTDEIKSLRNHLDDAARMLRGKDV